MNLQAYLCVSVFFVFLGVGFYVITHDSKSALNRIFLAVIMCSAIWTGAYSGLYIFNISQPLAWFWFKLSSLGWITLAACLLHFGLVLTGKDRSMKKWMIALLYLPAVVEIILMNTVILPAQAVDATRFTMIAFINPEQSWFWHIHTLYYLSYSIIFLVMVARWGKHSSYRREKRQASIFVVSGLVVLCSVVLNFIILPAFGHWIPWLILSVGFIWAGAIVYAMKKYGLMILSPALVADDILARVTDMVLLVDRSGHIILANTKAADILGYSVDEMHNMPLAKIIPQVELRNMEMEVDCLTARAELVPVKAYFDTVVDKLQDIVGILVIGQDLRLTRQLERKIVEKNRVELALRKSEEQYRDLFENANDLIYMHDLDGKFLSVNKATEKLLGYSNSELVHFNTLDIVVPDQLRMVIETFNQNKDEHAPVYYEVSVINRYGERYELDVSRRLIYENGNYIYQCIGRDVTERKRMEEKLKFLSMHDSLTGLYNRAYFSEELSRLESGHDDPVGLIMCDLDDLKKINDSIGHDAGDELIITAVRLIQSCLASNDVMARIGGDEFAIALPHSNEDVCMNLVGKIKSAVKEHNKISPNIIGVSVGFAVRSSTQQKMDEVLKLADHAMYVDKAERKKSTGS